MNIPIYRAKKIDSDEYVEGDLLNDIEEINIIQGLWWEGNKHFSIKHEIDPSTLAIHFPDMLDSEGNKIFASLSKDGKGGDNLIWNGEDIKVIAKYSNDDITFILSFDGGRAAFMNKEYCSNFTIIGIQK